MHTRTDDPAYRHALEAAVRPLPAADSQALWHDAEMIAREDGAATVSPSHLRQALRLQLADRQAIESEPGWSRERRLGHGRCARVQGAERLGI